MAYNQSIISSWETYEDQGESLRSRSGKKDGGGRDAGSSSNELYDNAGDDGNINSITDYGEIREIETTDPNVPQIVTINRKIEPEYPSKNWDIATLFRRNEEICTITDKKKIAERTNIK